MENDKPNFKPIEQNPEHYPFRSAKELAIKATSCGMTVREYMNLYFENINEATNNYWYSASRFRAKINYVTKDKTKSGLTIFLIHYFFGHDYTQTGRIQIIGVKEDNNIHGTIDIGRKAKEVSQAFLKTNLEDVPEVYIVQAYSQKRFKNVIDVQLVNKMT